MCNCKFEIQPKRQLTDAEMISVVNKSLTPKEMEKLWNDIFQPTKYYHAATCSKCYSRVKNDLQNLAYGKA